jgi:hypothetical protein
MVEKAMVEVPGAPNTFYDAMTRLCEGIVASGQQRKGRQLLI